MLSKHYLSDGVCLLLIFFMVAFLVYDIVLEEFEDLAGVFGPGYDSHRAYNRPHLLI